MPSLKHVVAWTLSAAVVTLVWPVAASAMSVRGPAQPTPHMTPRIDPGIGHGIRIDPGLGNGRFGHGMVRSNIAPEQADGPEFPEPRPHWHHQQGGVLQNSWTTGGGIQNRCHPRARKLGQCPF